MKKTLTVTLLAVALALPASATYIVVLKGGQQYKAKSKWTVANGKAIVQLENGQTLQLDPNDIDAAKSEQVTKLGLGNVSMIETQAAPAPTTKAPQPSLGNKVRLRDLGGQTAAPPKPRPSQFGAPEDVVPVTGPKLSDEAVEKFDRAYENVGVFEKKVFATGPNSLRADLTTDNEDRVFNTISATSFLMVRNAGIANVKIDSVEIYMKTTTGGSAGRFKMSREEAEALEKIPVAQREPALHDYYVRKVLF
jgi:hypothetical protein